MQYIIQILRVRVCICKCSVFVLYYVHMLHCQAGQVGQRTGFGKWVFSSSLDNIKLILGVSCKLLLDSSQVTSLSLHAHLSDSSLYRFFGIIL
jgi:hypothetical protein